MLFMVIERFKDRDQIKSRFDKHGRMLPTGVTYINGWIETSGNVCYQVMDAPDLNALREWTAHWEDLVDFELIPVVTSAEFNS